MKIEISDFEMSKKGTSTCSYLNTRFVDMLQNQKSEIGNKNMDMFVFEHIGFLYMSQNWKWEHWIFLIGKS